ncbi:hypothetical protein MSSAC_2490 [Methanosarcina siciliae C2J]|uniref:Uncharacterized protein n=1 Tax=Methanosarcina siciliae C2J TaxID=1434118 RepID=A0A0E3PPC2_9EURY|nr:hypothetical protein [Methanosarcina siciliae]AKB37080.1 hypothetical protein MSSAC_2490 [Methanosarcina siciliae C2J]
MHSVFFYLNPVNKSEINDIDRNFGIIAALQNFNDFFFCNDSTFPLKVRSTVILYSLLNKMADGVKYIFQKTPERVVSRFQHVPPEMILPTVSFSEKGCSGKKLQIISTAHQGRICGVLDMVDIVDVVDSVVDGIFGLLSGL